MLFLKWLKFWCMILLGLMASAAVCAQSLTEEQLAWIEANPVIPYTFVPSWPLDYFEDGKHTGLSRDYLDHLERQTGLRFVMANDAPELAILLAAVTPELISAQVKPRWQFTHHWLVSNALIVAHHNSSNIRSLEKLRGKRVAVRAGTFYESWLRDNHPEIHLVPVSHTLDIFGAVEKGEADVGLGSDLVIRPLFNRYYSHQLAIAGEISELAAGVAMGIDAQTPELLSIVNKVLSEMTAKESQLIFERWVQGMKLGSPTLGVILAIYRWELLLFTLLVMSLALALSRTVQLKKRAIASELRKTQFLAMMSHEIRTPMNALTAALELLRLPADEKRHREYIELACCSSKNMLALLNSILDHSKLSDKSLKLELSCFSLRAMIDSASESYRPSADQKGLQILTTFSRGFETLWIRADALRLRQIIINLLSNAIKFTETGTITIRVSGDFFPDNTCMLRISVTDTGIGIRVASQKRLFDAWSQADTSTARRYDGSGLGLYICRELTELMRGSISCKSLPGKGATFTVRVPISLSAQPVAAEAREEALPRFVRGTSVLIVEDHPANQHVISGQLKVLGCEVEIAGDGLCALALLEDENYYDAILLDCNLPDMDGYTVAQEIRRLEGIRNTPAVPIIAISAMNDSAHQQRCTASGMDKILSKPVGLTMLAEALLHWCEAEQAIQPLPKLQLPAPEVMLQWLQPDLKAFSEASHTRENKKMIYHIHRLRGVAEMYHLHALARLAGEIEQQLTQGSEVTPALYHKWCDELTSSVTSVVHP